MGYNIPVKNPIQVNPSKKKRKPKIFTEKFSNLL